MTEINDSKPMKIHKIGNYQFKIGDTRSLSEYQSGGFVTQVKMPKMLTFKQLSRAENEAEFTFLLTDLNKLGNPQQIQMAFTAYHRFVERHQREPKPWHESDSLDFMKLCLERADELSLEVDVDLVTKFSKTCRGNVAPMNSIIGGVAAQEVMKACSGKFMPISQYFCFDALECLRDEETMPKIVSQQCGYRYDSQAIVFGDDIQRKIEDLKVRFYSQSFFIFFSLIFNSIQEKKEKKMEKKLEKNENFPSLI
jgi:ubiquitin-activating enzyme E1